jgi:hypothetical protein
MKRRHLVSRCAFIALCGWGALTAHMVCAQTAATDNEPALREIVVEFERFLRDVDPLSPARRVIGLRCAACRMSVALLN